MLFSAQDEIAAPPQAVFRVLTDADIAWRLADRYGADMTRRDAGGPLAVGAIYDLRVRLRGADRKVCCEITTLDPARVMGLRADVAGLLCQIDAALAPRAAGRTGLTLTAALKPESLAGRMLLQTLRLARPRLTGQYEAGVRRFAAEIEALCHGRYRRRGSAG